MEVKEYFKDVEKKLVELARKKNENFKTAGNYSLTLDDGSFYVNFFWLEDFDSVKIEDFELKMIVAVNENKNG